MNKFLLSLMVLLPLSTIAVAQDANEEETIEEVVTTGIKSSLKDAIDIKRRNVGVVDAISAEDIGKFPDGNLAEALSRIVGVTTERSNDEGTKISVRGLGPEFNLVTLNGRSMPTVPGRYAGGRSFNFGDISSHGIAAVEVYKSANATLPTGGLGSTVNMVTTKPLDINKDSIGSFSVKAYDHSKGAITPEADFLFATKNMYNDMSWGISISGSHQERENKEDGTNEISWLPMLDEGLTYRIPSNSVITNNNTRADGEYFYPEALNYRFKNNTRVRDNAQAAFQFELGKVRTTLDYTWSDVEFETDGVQFGSYFAGWNNREMVINENGAVISGMETHQIAADPFKGESFTNSITWGENKSTNKSLGLNIEIAATDSLTLEIDIHNSSAAKKGNPDGSYADNNVTFTGGSWPGFGNGGIFEQAGSMFDRRFDFNNPVGALSWLNKRYYCCDANGAALIPDVTEFEAQDMVAREGSIVYEDKRSDNSQIQFNGTWNNDSGLLMESLTSVEFGISRLKQNFVAQKYRNDMKGSSNLGPGNPIMLAYGLWDNDAFTKVNLSDYLGSGTDTHYLTMTPEQAQYLFERTGWLNYSVPGENWFSANGHDTWECTADDAVDANGNPNGLTNGATGLQTTTRGVMCKGGVDSDESVSEVIESLYANFNFEYTTSNGGEVRAQLGLRYEDVTRSSVGAAALPVTTIWGFGDYGYEGVAYGPQRINMVDGPVQTFVDTGASDSFLPNFNISYEFAENKLVRFSASKTLARPALETLSSSFTMSQFVPFSPRQVFSGNPDLQPYNAENFDVAYEHYYKEGSYFAVNYFRKDISDYHGSGQGTTSFNNVYDVAGGDLADNIDNNVTDAFCQWTGSQGYWGCAPWVNQVQDYAWIIGTGESFGCAASGRSAAGCVTSTGGDGNAVFVGSGADGDPLAQFELYKPVNKYDGTLDGFEIAVQHLFDNNFGVLANATFVGGDTDVDAAYVGEQFALPGFGDAANLSVFYENENYSARLSYNLKAETYAGMDAYNPLFVEERGQVDISASYNIEDNAVVFFEAQNITDEDVRIFARHSEMLFLYQDQGPVYKAGFRYRF